MGEVDVFVQNLTLIDWELHELWIKGFSATDAAAVLRDRGITTQYPGATQDLLVSDVNDNYRLFAMQEHLLLTVGNLSDQMLYQLSPDTADLFLERYYSLDSSFCRELLGKKLSSRVRRDLDEVSEKTGVTLKSCRRQFDNLKRVFKAIEDLPGGYVTNITKNFGLSRDLAERYATLVFVLSLRFDMSKRKLNCLSFENIRAISAIIMEDWIVCGDDDVAIGGEGGEPALDKDFLTSLKDLRVLLDRDKEHRNVVCSRLQNLPDRVSSSAASEIESSFKAVSRNLLSVGQSLASSSKEGRDFFVLLVERVVEPLRQLRLDRGEVEALLTAYVEAVTDDVLLVDEGIKATLKRFMGTLTPCVLAVY